MKNTMSELYEPIVKIEGSMYIDMTDMEKDGSMMITLVNTSGSHDDADVFTMDEISAIGPAVLNIRLKSKTETVTVEPKGYVPDMTWNKGSRLLTINIPQIDIHEIVVVKSQ